MVGGVHMEYIGVIIFMILIIMICIVFVLKFKRSQGVILSTTDNPNGEKSEQEFTTENIQNELVIQMEMLPAEEIIDENKLVEITNSKVLAHVNNLVPGLAQVGNVAHNAAQAAQANGEVLYRAIILVGTKLTDSKAMENAVRGIYHGTDGIKGHANLVAVEAQKGTASCS
ncbi:hypothetical protein [Garciella nitratireducens]|jgi:hypothetical protein|uniref:hypothetical protein n=1 Tax=Garciella nitratireducens TaxID=218205 RepID=UPI001A9A338B|nr:hypothetical protein [Garciella nitratireducens]